MIRIFESRKIRQIPVANIVRIEAKGMYTIFYCKNREQYICSRYLKRIIPSLDSRMFFRIHKSHVINANEMMLYEKYDGYVLMSDKSKVSVSKRIRPVFMKWLRQV